MPDDVYRGLEEAARDRGVSAAEWIAGALSVRSSVANRPLSETLDGLIGVIDSRTGSPVKRNRTPFSAMIAKKMEKQGLRRR